MVTSVVETGEGYLATLTPVPQSVGIARMFVRHKLLCMRYADLIDNAETITSELVTNAIKATKTANPMTAGHIRLYLGLVDGRPLLEVWDTAPWLPRFKEPDDETETGRGLHIVKKLAANMGWREDPGRGGKIVWAFLV